eukprot:m.53484 g.53484  ORF g.53484 m.53484 type:complete len:243 (-) comp11366_c0_seq4:2074-2802(-)
MSGVAATLTVRSVRRMSHAAVSHGVQHASWRVSKTLIETAVMAHSGPELQLILSKLTPESRRALALALHSKDLTPHVSEANARVLFQTIDVNTDGKVSEKEFEEWFNSLKEMETPIADAPTQAPTMKQLVYHGIRHTVPMVGFGFLDNFIMISAGETIDNTLGSTLHLSTMAAAGLGNLFSDVVGLGFSNTIEAAASKIGLPDPKMTPQQLALPICSRISAAASMVGISLGCLAGMIPLLFK